MPKEFDMCVNKGGRVRTKELGGGKYMHICFMNGKSFAGEVKMKKQMNKMMGPNLASKKSKKYKILKNT